MHQKIEINNKDLVILTDYIDKDSNLARMVKKFQSCFTKKAKLYNLHDIDIKGGCLGCLQCGLDNKCVYNDAFSELFQAVKNKDILVYAGTITDRHLSSRWKLYFDRCFCNGHTPATEGSQLCVLISGDLQNNENLRQWFIAFADLGYANLVDIVCDQYADSQKIDELIYTMARKAAHNSERSYIAPSTFYKVGGYKIFRDMIFGLPGALFRRDYKFFKKRGMFDFPTKNIKSRLTRSFLSFLLNFKSVRKRFKSDMKSTLIGPLKKRFEKIDFNMEQKRLKND